MLLTKTFLVAILGLAVALVFAVPGAALADSKINSTTGQANKAGQEIDSKTLQAIRSQQQKDLKDAADRLKKEKQQASTPKKSEPKPIKKIGKGGAEPRKKPTTAAEARKQQADKERCIKVLADLVRKRLEREPDIVEMQEFDARCSKVYTYQAR